ncbi:MAG: adenosylcobinamide amidohydrolase [Haloarculaceae archaeon]
MFETAVREGVCRCRAPGARWLSTALDGGFVAADAAYNVTVPEGFDRRDLDAYAAERRSRAGFEAVGPALLTGVEMRHARAATHGPVTVVATAGLSNPATLPLDPTPDADSDPDPDAARSDRQGWRPGTVNLLVGTDRALDDGGLATLLATAVEAKTATLLGQVGFSGTTSDALVVGCRPDGQAERFAGSATAVGEATRACVRDALLAGLAARYEAADAEIPATVADATYGVETDASADVFVPYSRH